MKQKSSKISRFHKTITKKDLKPNGEDAIEETMGKYKKVKV